MHIKRWSTLTRDVLGAGLVSSARGKAKRSAACLPNAGGVRRWAQVELRLACGGAGGVQPLIASMNALRR